MDLNWLQGIAYGFCSGLMDVLPVSAQAHRVLLLKLFGTKGSSDLLHLLIHTAIVFALYISCNAHVVRMSRAKRLSRVPKRKRKRPLDTRSLMDLSVLKTMLVPVILGMLLYPYTFQMEKSLLITALFLFLNGVILYVPQFLPTGNKDSRNLSRVEGLLMGLGGAVSILPGMSAMGVTTSISSVCGVDRSYGLNMALLMNLFVNIGFLVHDALGIVSGGMGTLTFSILLIYIATAAAAFAASMLGVRLLRRFAEGDGYSTIGLYCFGLSLFMFNLVA